MVKILFPAHRCASFSKKQDGSLGSHLKTGFGVGGAVGAGVSGVAIGTIMKNPNNPKFTPLTKLSPGRKALAMAHGTSRIMTKAGLAGAAIGAGVYGAKKLVNKIRGKKY